MHQLNPPGFKMTVSHQNIGAFGMAEADPSLCFANVKMSAFVVVRIRCTTQMTAVSHEQSSGSTFQSTVFNGNPVYLAKLLLDAPDVLLMDEPTNFLDVEHIEWLSKFLNSFDKAFVVISHDEAFIRSIAKGVWSLDNKTMTYYNMNYDLYLKERAIREDNYRKSY